METTTQGLGFSFLFLFLLWEVHFLPSHMARDFIGSTLTAPQNIWALKPYYLGPWTLRRVDPYTLRVQVLNDWVLGFWVIVIVVQVLGKYMIIRYLDP